MFRPSTAREALSFFPLVQASWAYASSVEGVPHVTAGAGPAILFARRPAAERATDAWTAIIALFESGVAINYSGSLVSHPRYYAAHEHAN